MEKRRRRDARNHLRTRSRCPFFSGERVLPPCRRMALSPPFLASTESLLCWRGSRYGCVARISTNRWRSGSRGLSPARWALSSVGIVAPGLDFNIMTQRGRASATVQVVSDLQCPASEGVAYVLQGEWDLAGRRCAAGSGSAGAVDPRGICVPWAAMDACCWAEIALK
ncbi:Uncharacterized protein conserved in bacteria [Klebsiella pneumoniae]|uniref:Uncharacterized protein conserved in bacteria n=1 Tax=Klebsiella pneumoniae TaxID=573 RepID=A0A2X3CQC8_KLEPN|nr:Uncharacterized protein conserved in bacteria [Klebsiella pneumoniae]